MLAPALLFVYNCKAQQLNFGAIAQVQFYIGTHSIGAGASAGAYAFNHNMQINSRVQATFFNKHLGPSRNFFEARWQNGISVAMGKTFKGTESRFAYNAASYFGARPLRLAYVYNLYFDTRGTSQSTGTIKAAYRNFNVSTENDAFAFRPYDKHRTGSFSIFYSDSFRSAGAFVRLFTHFPQKQEVQSSRFNKSLNNSSNGILALHYTHVFAPVQNVVHAAIGVDDEAVRDVVQNKLVHRYINKRHQKPVPLLARDGSIRKDKTQSIKPTKLYIQAGVGAIDAY